jgi:hypothetical protein
MKLTIIVLGDEAQSAIIDQGDTQTTVAPGQNATVEVTSTHPITLGVSEPHESEPEIPAAPVVTDAPTVGQADAPTSEATAPAIPEPVIQPTGDTGASVVPSDAPAEVQAVADALQQTNTAVAEATNAASDFAEATATAAAAADDLTAAQDAAAAVPEDAAPADQAAADQAAADAKAALDKAQADADAAAEAHATAIDTANASAETAQTAADAVAAAAADPDHPATDDHAEIAQQMADSAAQAVADAPALPSTGDATEAAPAAPQADGGGISTAGDTGTTLDGAGNTTTGPTVVDEQLAQQDAPLQPGDPIQGDVTLPPAGDEPATVGVADAPEAPAGVKIETDEDLRNVIAGLLDGDVSTDDVLSLSTLNAALEAKGYAPITEEQHEVAKDALSDL